VDKEIGRYRHTYKDRHTDRQRYKQRDTQTDIQRERDKEAVRHRHTKRQTDAGKPKKRRDDVRESETIVLAETSRYPDREKHRQKMTERLAGRQTGRDTQTRAGYDSNDYYVNLLRSDNNNCSTNK